MSLTTKMQNRNFVIVLVLFTFCCSSSSKVAQQKEAESTCGSLQADLSSFLVDQNHSSKSAIGWKIPFQYYFDQTRPVVEPMNLWMIVYPLSYPFSGYSATWISPQSKEPQLCQQLSDWNPNDPDASICGAASCSAFSDYVRAMDYWTVRYTWNLDVVKISDQSLSLISFPTFAEGKHSPFGNIRGEIRSENLDNSYCPQNNYSQMVTGLYAGKMTDGDYNCIISSNGRERLQNNLIYQQTGKAEPVTQDRRLDLFFRNCVAGILTEGRAMPLSENTQVSSRAQCWHFADTGGLNEYLLLDIFPENIVSKQGSCDRRLGFVTRIYKDKERLYMAVSESGLIARIKYQLHDIIAFDKIFGFLMPLHPNITIFGDESLAKEQSMASASISCQDGSHINYCTDSDNNIPLGCDELATCDKLSGRLNTCGKTWYIEHFVDGETIKFPLVGRWYLPLE